VLVAIVKKRLNLDLSLHAMQQILSVTSFEKVYLLQLFTDLGPTDEMDCPANQLTLL
jgi:hypothetical protein